MISALTIATDRSNYCRYERGKDVVTVTVRATGAAGGEVIPVVLRRATPYGNLRTLDTQNVVLPAPVSGASTGTVTFQLRALKDADGYMTAKLSHAPNNYEAFASDAASGKSASAFFTVMAISVELMRGKWMLGLPLYTIERFAPRIQPKLVTGVTVTDVSRGTSLGSYLIALQVSGANKSLSWAGGGAVALDLSGPTAYVLSDTKGEYVTVSVEPALLPGVSKSETLTIDLAVMSDMVIIDEVTTAYADLEPGVACRLEPTRVVSKALAEFATVKVTEYDEVGEGLTYYKPLDFARWLEIKFPYHSLLKLKSLSGWFNRTKTVDVDQDWFAITERTGQVELVPSTASQIGWTFYGPGFYTIFMGLSSVPNFWNYDLVCGLRELPGNVSDFIAMRASITLLTMAGQARFAGVTSSSVSRDGVSESRSTVPGVYGATIDKYMQQTGLMPDGSDRGVVKLRARYAGPVFITLAG